MANRKRSISEAVPTAFAVRVTTRAKKDEIFEITPEGLVKIRLKAPPVEGKANQALLELLARVLDKPASQIFLVTGLTRRDKLVLVEGMNVETTLRRLRETISSGK